MRVSREHIRKREGERRQAGASTADTDATRVLFFFTNYFSEIAPVARGDLNLVDLSDVLSRLPRSAYAPLAMT